VAISRSVFNREVAPSLLEGDRFNGPSTRFVWGHSESGVTVVAGPAEGRYCDLALAYGLTVAGGRELRLVLPERQAGATLHRLAWLTPPGGVRVETHARNGRLLKPRRIPSRAEALKAYLSLVTAAHHKKDGLETEFRQATVPHHLRYRSAWVAPLVDAVAAREEIDPAHLKGERAWHCRGQKLLRLTRTSAGVRVEAGIMRDDLKCQFEITGPLTQDEFELARRHVEDGVARRLGDDPDFHKPDEHWLQAVLRRNAHLVGLEARVLREVPAWRRRGALDLRARSAWGRGYIDLLGVDPHGNVQVVETKLATYDDPMFILQGLDYLMYCEAYRKPITRRLDVREDAPIGIKYVVGAPDGRQLRMSRFAPAQLCALPSDLAYEVLTLTDWFHRPRRPAEARVAVASDEAVLQLSKASSKPAATASGGGGWSRAEIDRAVSELPLGIDRTLVEHLLEQADDRGATFIGGTGAAPSAGLYYPVAGKSRSVWSLYVRDDGPTLRINLGPVRQASPTRAEAATAVLCKAPALASLFSSAAPTTKTWLEIPLREVLQSDEGADRTIRQALDLMIDATHHEAACAAISLDLPQAGSAQGHARTSGVGMLLGRPPIKGLSGARIGV
jgi:hypothetical protein